MNSQKYLIIKIGEYYLTKTDITIDKTETPTLTTNPEHAWRLVQAEARPIARLFGGKAVHV